MGSLKIEDKFDESNRESSRIVIYKFRGSIDC